MKPYYEHAGITIYCADWRACESVLSPLYDLLLTDPPYGIGEAAGKNLSRSKPFGTFDSRRSSPSRTVHPKDYGNLGWDDLDQLETCEECGGSGISESCDRCTQLNDYDQDATYA